MNDDLLRKLMQSRIEDAASATFLEQTRDMSIDAEAAEPAEKLFMGGFMFGIKWAFEHYRDAIDALMEAERQ